MKKLRAFTAAIFCLTHLCSEAIVDDMFTPSPNSSRSASPAPGVRSRSPVLDDGTFRLEVKSFAQSAVYDPYESVPSVFDRQRITSGGSSASAHVPQSPSSFNVVGGHPVAVVSARDTAQASEVFSAADRSPLRLLHPTGQETSASQELLQRKLQEILTQFLSREIGGDEYLSRISKCGKEFPVQDSETVERFMKYYTDILLPLHDSPLRYLLRKSALENLPNSALKNKEALLKFLKGKVDAVKSKGGLFGRRASSAPARSPLEDILDAALSELTTVPAVKKLSQDSATCTAADFIAIEAAFVKAQKTFSEVDSVIDFLTFLHGSDNKLAVDLNDRVLVRAFLLSLDPKNFTVEEKTLLIRKLVGVDAAMKAANQLDVYKNVQLMLSQIESTPALVKSFAATVALVRGLHLNDQQQLVAADGKMVTQAQLDQIVEVWIMSVSALHPKGSFLQLVPILDVAILSKLANVKEDSMEKILPQQYRDLSTLVKSELMRAYTVKVCLMDVADEFSFDPEERELLQEFLMKSVEIKTSGQGDEWNTTEDLLRRNFKAAWKLYQEREAGFGPAPSSLQPKTPPAKRASSAPVNN